ncbi:MAG: type II toxin-antitoxin system HicB family antitoxin [Firmicutes bacterium]|nr:type II toxin-antitoxin system HicB family antitoxin [Bacillota bacterium]
MENLKNYRFEVSINVESGNTEYVVRFIDVPNISGVGDTLEEAVTEAEGNLKYYFDYLKDKNLEIPSPTQPIPFPDLSGKITLRMSHTLHMKIIERSLLERVSINTLVTEALTSYVCQKSEESSRLSSKNTNHS